VHLKRVESRGLRRDDGGRGIRSTKQKPPHRRRHGTVGTIEVVAGFDDHTGSGHDICWPTRATGQIKPAPNHVTLQVQEDLAVRCEVDREDSVCRTRRADNGSHHLHSKHRALVGRLQIRVERHNDQAPAGATLDGRRSDDLAFLDARGEEVTGRSRHNGDRVPRHQPPGDIFDHETSYGRTITESKHVADDRRRGPQERSSRRLEPGRQPRFVKAHDALSEEGRAVGHGERLTHVVHPGPNEDARSCIGW